MDSQLDNGSKTDESVHELASDGLMFGVPTRMFVPLLMVSILLIVKIDWLTGTILSLFLVIGIQRLHKDDPQAMDILRARLSSRWGSWGVAHKKTQIHYTNTK